MLKEFLLQRMKNRSLQPAGETENVLPRDAKEFIKVYGERNTGTHWILRLIGQNFHAESIPGTLAEACPGYRETIEENLQEKVSDKAKRIWIRQAMMDAYFTGNLWSTLGWKHAVPPIDTILSRPDRDKILFITVVKNPYAWALSLFRRPYDYLGIGPPDDFSQFIGEPWPTLGRDNAPAILDSPISLWNIKAAGYADLSRVTTVINCRYEDVLVDPANLLDPASKLLNRKTDEFTIPLEATKQTDKELKNLKYYQDYYLGEKWREELTFRDISLINRFLDPNIVKQAGYEMLAEKPTQPINNDHQEPKPNE